MSSSQVDAGVLNLSVGSLEYTIKYKQARLVEVSRELDNQLHRGNGISLSPALGPDEFAEGVCLQ